MNIQADFLRNTLQSSLLCMLLVLTLTGCARRVDSSDSEKPSMADAAPTEPGLGFLPENAVVATIPSIQDGTYKPLSRPLFIYVNKQVLKRPEAVAYLRFLFSDLGSELVREAGFVEIPDDEFHAQLAILNNAISEIAGDLNFEDLKGQLIIDGSSTVAPVATIVAEEFSKVNRRVRVPIGTSGTGGGFKKFSTGEISICNASRPISESEITICEKNGIEYLELVVCLDGITIVVNPHADWIAGITTEDLHRIWVTGSKIQKWSDINPEYPDAPLKLFGPDTDSGTFEYFTSTICKKKGASRSDYQQSGDDNFLVTGVATDRYAMGYFGYSYYLENHNKVKALAVAPQ